MLEIFCPKPESSLLLISNSVPDLVYYSHIPTSILALVFGVFVFHQNKNSVQARLVLLIATLFFLWSFFDVILWATNDSRQVMFFWSMQILLELSIYVASAYLAHRFLYEKNMGVLGRAILLSPLLFLICFLPTKWVMSHFVLSEACEAVEGVIAVQYVYGAELLISIFITIFFVQSFFTRKESVDLKKKRFYFLLGLALFLFSFSLGNILGSVITDWKISQYGLFGMPVFIGFLAYLIVRYKEFNIKLLGVQALTVTLWVLVGALFFLSQNMTNRIVTGVTFLLAVVFGVKLMQSVKREVEQRERIEKLAEDLSAANEKLRGLDKLKSEFLSLASHQLRSPLTAIKGYTSMLLEGTFGQLQEQQREINVRILESSQSLINMIEDFLNVSKIEQGGMQYAFAPIDLSKMVSTLFAEMKISAENKHLEFKLEMEEGGTFMANVDAGKLKQVFMNLVDNSIKYTPNGFVHVSLVRNKDKNTITFAVKDSGVGVNPETKDKLFQKFSRGEGGKLNTGGSGLGLYLAQEITKAHKGEIVIESEGLGKGSTFAVTLPAVVE